MALTLIKEDGTGLANANSYASAADGDTYHAGHYYASVWTSATTGNKEIALVMATRLIDASYQFNGFKKGSVQRVVSHRQNHLTIEGYPATTLTHQDWVPVWDGKYLLEEKHD